MISAIIRQAWPRRMLARAAEGADDIRDEIRRIILEELKGLDRTLMAKLRSYIFIDQLQAEDDVLSRHVLPRVSCRAPIWRRSSSKWRPGSTSSP